MARCILKITWRRKMRLCHSDTSKEYEAGSYWKVMSRVRNGKNCVRYWQMCMSRAQVGGWPTEIPYTLTVSLKRCSNLLLWLSSNGTQMASGGKIDCWNSLRYEGFWLGRHKLRSVRLLRKECRVSHQFLAYSHLAAGVYLSSRCPFQFLEVG